MTTLNKELQQDAILDVLVRVQSELPVSYDAMEQATRALGYYQAIRYAALLALEALGESVVSANPALKTLGIALGTISEASHDDTK